MADQDKESAQQRTCFVICPFGPEGSDVRARSDDVYNNLIKPVAEECGYEAKRLIDDKRPGEITPQIIAALYNADLVVADLTDSNPNVFYELALRHATGKPFIHLSENTGGIPFDVSPMNAVRIATGRFGDVDETQNELRGHFKAVQDGTANFDNPVSRHQERVRIEATGSPVEKQLAEVLERLALIEGRERVRENVQHFATQALPLTTDEMREIIRVTHAVGTRGSYLRRVGVAAPNDAIGVNALETLASHMGAPNKDDDADTED